MFNLILDFIYSFIQIFDFSYKFFDYIISLIDFIIS